MDCSKYIYCNANGTETLLTCSFSLHYRASDGTCVDPTISECPKCAAANVTTPDGNSTESTTIPTNSTIPTGSTIPVCPIQQNCTVENEYGTLPVIEDCTKYIYCPPEGQITIDCPAPQHYSPTMQVCMDPALAGCPKCTGATIPYCPEQPVCTPDLYYTQIPNIANCTFYIYCEPDGTELSIPCPEGEHYSPTQELCMAPELAGCPQCSGSTTPFCPEQPVCTPDLYYTSLPYIANCSIYIYCEPDGSELLIACPDGEHYSPAQNRCVNASEAGCTECLGTTLEYSSTEATTPGNITFATTIPVCPPQEHCTPVLFTSTLPYISNCSLFYYCGLEEELLACPDVLHYSPTIGLLLLTLVTTAQCEALLEIETTTTSYCDSQQYCTIDLAFNTLPYVADCTKYFYCDDQGNGLLRVCPEPNHYSPTELRCTDPLTAQCPDCSSDTTTTELPSTGSTMSYCDSQPQCDPEFPYTTLPYIEDCTKYIYCDVNGTEIIRLCPEFEEYSVQLEICTDPEIADCINCPDHSTVAYCDYQPHCTLELAFSLLPYITDCTKFIYCTEDGNDSMRECPEFQHFNPSELYCTDPESAMCPECGDTTTESLTSVTSP
ncbi:hypothetical protein B566_EDAN012165 [Ephemera danica]|nr:hypothetical protein B566_EDAN012165 [Ephemera danica]